MSCVGLVSVGNSYALRLGLWGIAGLEKASLGEGRGDVKGEAVEDFVLVKACGMNPGGASGLTPRRGEDEIGVAPRGICQGAGDGRRKTVCRKDDGEVAFDEASRYRQRTSKTAFSREFPTSVVSFLISSSNLSVFSSSTSAASERIGRQISYVASDTIFADEESIKFRESDVEKY
jgi:hypothetical protein